MTVLGKKITNQWPKQQGKEEQIKPKVSKRKEVIKIWAKTNTIGNRKTLEKINDTKSWFFEINKIDKPLVRLIKKKETRITIIKKEWGDITTDSIYSKRIIRKYYEHTYTS